MRRVALRVRRMRRDDGEAMRQVFSRLNHLRRKGPFRTLPRPNDKERETAIEKSQRLRVSVGTKQLETVFLGFVDPQRKFVAVRKNPRRQFISEYIIVAHVDDCAPS